jgi:hypothetical protein
MDTLAKAFVLDFDLGEYIFCGGYKFIPGKYQLPYEDVKGIADERWETKTGSIFTFYTNNYSLAFIYDSNFDYSSDQIEFYIDKDELLLNEKAAEEFTAVPLSDFLWRSKPPNIVIDEAFYDASELVLFARSGANLYFNKKIIGAGEIYLITKITCKCNLNESSRKLVRSILTPLTLDNIQAIKLSDSLEGGVILKIVRPDPTL